MLPSEPKILWLESGDLYTVQRGVACGRERGIQVESLEISDVRFVAGGHRTTGDSELVEVVNRFDALIVRSFVPYISEVLTVARCFGEAGKVVVDATLCTEGYAISKMHDYVFLTRAGVGVPRTIQCFDPSEVERHAEDMGYPCVLKNVHGSEGRHVFKVGSARELKRNLWRYRAGELVLQEFLAADVDYRVMVVGYKALPVMVRRKPRPGEFRTNFEFDEEVVALSTADHPEMAELAERAARVLQREFTGVDIRYRGGTPLVLEANRRPGFKAFEEATHFDVAGTFIEYVRERCAAAWDRG